MVPIQTTSRKINYIKYLNLIFCDFAMGGAMAPMAPLWIRHWVNITKHTVRWRITHFIQGKRIDCFWSFNCWTEFVHSMLPLVNAPFGQCSLWSMFPLVNAPFGQCSLLLWLKCHLGLHYTGRSLWWNLYVLN